MTRITNKTKRPLTIPLPGGKKLRLGPLKSGEINPKQVAHPPIQKLIEVGEVEVDTVGKKSGGGESAGGKGVGPSQTGGSFGGPPRQSGDR